ncbi:MAG: TOBE domain-containing protein, partial [Candidatus Omnitrophota bacterium]|nr:TOBE domain-containing protein [Candidatus Omnitrophota bacterium]
ATMIYVTHDQTEAMTMGDRIVILKDGVINQVADPIALYFKPVNKFVAGFIGSPPMNFMEGRIIKKDGNFYFDEGNFRVKITEEMIPYMQNYQDKIVIFGVRPEDIYDKLFIPDASPESTLSVTCEVIEPMGSEVYVHLTTGKNAFIARMVTGTDERAEIGQDIDLVFDMSKIHFFESKTQKIII